MQGASLQKAVDAYVFGYSAEQNLQKKTIVGKKETLNRVVNFLAGKELNLESAREYTADLKSKGWQASSIRCEVKVIRAFTNYLSKRGVLEKNWGLELSLPKVHKKKFELLAPELMDAIIEAGCAFGKHDNSIHQKIKKDMEIGLKFALRTGLRITELCNLAGSNFNLYDETPSFTVISKGGNEDMMPIPLDLLPELLTRLSKKRVFEITPVGCNIALKRGAEKLGVKSKVHAHLLRHIFCTSLLRSGAPLQKVSRLMRHKDVNITDAVYSHYVLNDLAQIINGNYSIVRSGLNEAQIFETIINAIHTTGIGKDDRYSLEVTKSAGFLEVKVSKT